MTTFDKNDRDGRFNEKHSYGKHLTVSVLFGAIQDARSASNDSDVLFSYREFALREVIEMFDRLSEIRAITNGEPLSLATIPVNKDAEDWQKAFDAKYHNKG